MVLGWIVGPHGWLGLRTLAVGAGAATADRSPHSGGGCVSRWDMLCAMAADLVISYDGTSNDDDALALGKLLAQTGSSVALAYLRHSREFDPQREQVAQHDSVRRAV